MPSGNVRLNVPHHIIHRLMHDSHDSLNADLPESFPQVLGALCAGEAVCLSDGRRKSLLTSAIPSNGSSRLLGDHAGRRAVLLLRDVDAALDFVSEPSALARRMIRNCWPGPVRLTFARGLDHGLLQQLPDRIRQIVETDHGVPLSVPRANLLRELLYRAPFPLVKLDLGVDTVSDPSLVEMRSDEESVAEDAEFVIDGDECKLMRRDGLTDTAIQQLTRARILFVCTGNTCRSPMAEGMFRQMLAARLGCSESELESRGFEVASAGLSAGQGASASPEAVSLCRAWGVDLSGHSSQPLTESLLLQSDLIFTMTADHRDAILSRYPELEDDVRLLSPRGADVSDPIGWGSAAYEQCLREITESLRALIDELAPSPDPAP